MLWKYRVESEYIYLVRGKSTENKWGSQRTEQIWAGPYPLTNTYVFWIKSSSKVAYVSLSGEKETERELTSI